MTLILVLSQDQPITIFDEVTSGLDFESRCGLMDLLKKWYQDKETTLLMISHYYEEIESLVNKILFLDQGKVLAFGRRDELFLDYCGKCIYIMDDRDNLHQILHGFRSLPAPKGKIVISCLSEEEEEALTKFLILKNINYRRSSNDIEVLTHVIRERSHFENQ